MKIMKLNSKKLRQIIREELKKYIDEGIDIDSQNKLVSFNPSHEDNVDTSIKNNPTNDGTIFKDVNVWSIFKRKKGEYLDGNPLIYALKGEKGWKFRSDADREAIELQFDKIASKFATLYPIGVTILVPSTNNLNRYIAEIVMSKSSNAELIEGVVCKITAEEVSDIVLEKDSKFHQVYKDNFNMAYRQLGRYLRRMDTERQGLFVRHYIDDPQMRNVLDVTLKLSDKDSAEFANKINGQNLLVIDDTISRGQTIKEMCRLILTCYKPKSITVLTLLSKL